MKEELIETIYLDNNQIVNVYDASRKVGIDVWVIVFILKMDIEINKSIFDEKKYSNIHIEKIKQKLGDVVIFEIKKERNFINIDNRDNVFKLLKDEYLKSSLNYISRHDFTAKFVLKKYNEQKKRLVF